MSDDGGHDRELDGVRAAGCDVRAQFQAATSDIREGLRRWRSWSYLSVENVKNRYRRTVSARGG